MASVPTSAQPAKFESGTPKYAPPSIVEDASEEPTVAAHGDRIDHDVQQHHEKSRSERERPPTGASAERGPSQAEGRVSEERERQRVHQRRVGHVQLSPARGAGIVVEAERHADARG